MKSCPKDKILIYFVAEQMQCGFIELYSITLRSCSPGHAAHCRHKFVLL